MKNIILGAVLAVASFSALAIDPTYPVESKNMNVRTIYERYQMMLEEIGNSVTHGTIGTSPHDATRWKSYLAGLASYMTYWQGENIADWPVTHGRRYQLGDPLTVSCSFKDNLASCDLIDIVSNARDELVVSASSTGMPMHLLPDDLRRQQDAWSMMTGFIDQYMLVVQPLDEPVTSAQEALGLDPGTPAAAN